MFGLSNIISMEITYILLALSFIALVLLLLSPRYDENYMPHNKKRREIDEIKFAESQSGKRMQNNESLQYGVMRIVTSVFIGALGIYGATLCPESAKLFLAFAFVFIVLANIMLACGHLKGFDVILFTEISLIGKIVAQILFAIGISIIIDNGEVCLPTILLGFIVGAILLKLLVHKTTPVHSYFALANALKFSNLALAIIALLYRAYAFPILLIVGYVLLLSGSTAYVVNKKGFEFLSSCLHYLGYIFVALSFNFV